MSATVIIDGVTLLLAGYALVVCLNNRDFLPAWIAGVYLVAQTGWTASFLLGNLWGATLNNYVWFLFNTSVFTYILWEGWRK